MKRLTFLLLMLLTTIISFSQTTEELARDEDFVNYLTTSVKLALIVKEKVSSPEDREQLNAAIEDAKTQKMSNEEQIAFVNNLFNFSDADSFAIHSSTIALSYKNLTIKYPELTLETFEAAGEQVLSRGCGWRFFRCSAARTFEGGLMLAACEAITAGVGTPLCVIGVSLWLDEEIDECAEKHC